MTWLTAEGRQRSINAGIINLRKFARAGADSRWRGKLPIPPHAHPIVRRLFEIMNSQQTLLREVSRRSGIAYDTISCWRTNRQPSLPNIEAALNAVGYEIKIVPINRKGKAA